VNGEISKNVGDGQIITAQPSPTKKAKKAVTANNCNLAFSRKSNLSARTHLSQSLFMTHTHQMLLLRR